jgi:hypothetical protein
MSSAPPAISLKNSKLASPFSLRLTFKERSILEQAAGDMPLAYIRSKLLNESEVPRRVRKRTRKPLKDEQAMALLLGELGKARLANNLNQLAKAVNIGSLSVTPDTEKALQRACAAVQDMRDLLLQALGFPAGGVP